MTKKNPAGAPPHWPCRGSLPAGRPGGAGRPAARTPPPAGTPAARAVRNGLVPWWCPPHPRPGCPVRPARCASSSSIAAAAACRASRRRCSGAAPPAPHRPQSRGPRLDPTQNERMTGTPSAAPGNTMPGAVEISAGCGLTTPGVLVLWGSNPQQAHPPEGGLVVGF